MISEEIGLNDHLEAQRHPPGRDRSRRIHHPAPERDRRATSSRPPLHLNRGGGRRDFRRVAHASAARPRSLATPRHLLTEARTMLRESFLAADVGITGANFLIAETGTSVIVTNEGNGDLTQTLPRVHIVVAAIEKIVPTLEDASPDAARCWRARRPGRRFSVYTTFSHRRRAGRAIPTGRSSIMSCCSTTAARRCSAPSSRTCCAASAAAPA